MEREHRAECPLLIATLHARHCQGQQHLLDEGAAEPFRARAVCEVSWQAVTNGDDSEFAIHIRTH